MNKTQDASIPVLTEIIAPPAARAAAASDLTPDLRSETTGNFPVSFPQQAAVPLKIGADLSAEEWEMLERKLSERILQQLQARIDFVLEHRVRDSLADVLQTAVAELATEIRSGLQQTLHEVISRAIAQEIAKLQSGKNPG